MAQTVLGSYNGGRERESNSPMSSMDDGIVDIDVSRGPERATVHV